MTMEMCFIGAMAAVLAIGCVGEAVSAFVRRGRRIRETEEEARTWKTLCRSAVEERDLLLRRLNSRDCQKILFAEEKLDEARAEIERLTVLNETYRKELERKKKAPASSDKAGQAQKAG